MTSIGALIWAALAGLPAVVVALIALAALTLGIALTHGALSLYDRLRTHEPPPELKSEIATVQRELIRLANRREINGGSIWPIERPYRDLPAEQWKMHGSRLRLDDADRKAVSHAYELAARFNDEMLRGETFLAAPEPDLDGLRHAFNGAAEAVGLPSMSEVSESGGEQPPELRLGRVQMPRHHDRWLSTQMLTQSCIRKAASCRFQSLMPTGELRPNQCKPCSISAPMMCRARIRLATLFWRSGTPTHRRPASTSQATVNPSYSMLLSS